MYQIIDLHSHKEHVDTHEKNTCKQDAYKCRKEQIHTHIKNTLRHIQSIQVNKTHTNVAKNGFIHT